MCSGGVMGALRGVWGGLNGLRERAYQREFQSSYSKRFTCTTSIFFSNYGIFLYYWMWKVLKFLFSVDEIARRKKCFFLKIFANQQKLITFRTFNINMTLFVRTLNFLFPNKPFDTSSILFLIAITKRWKRNISLVMTFIYKYETFFHISSTMNAKWNMRKVVWPEFLDVPTDLILSNVKETWQVFYQKANGFNKKQRMFLWVKMVF